MSDFTLAFSDDATPKELLRLAKLVCCYPNSREELNSGRLILINSAALVVSVLCLGSLYLQFAEGTSKAKSVLPCVIDNLSRRLIRVAISQM